MTRILRHTSTFVFLLTVMVSSMQASSALDQSTPRAAAIAFDRSVGMGDIENAKACSFGTPEQVEGLVAMCKRDGAQFQLAVAAVIRWGYKDNPFVHMTKVSTSDSENADYATNGDDATRSLRLHAAKEADAEKLRLKRVGGVWKVNLGTVKFLPSGKVLQVYANSTQVYAEINRNVNAGKYASANDAFVALYKALSPPK